MYMRKRDQNSSWQLYISVNSNQFKAKWLKQYSRFQFYIISDLLKCNIAVILPLSCSVNALSNKPITRTGERKIIFLRITLKLALIGIHPYFWYCKIIKKDIALFTLELPKNSQKKYIYIGESTGNLSIMFSWQMQ